MTPEERAAREGMHPSVAANFVYLPDPAALTDEQLHRLFPPEQVKRFFRDCLIAQERQQAANGSGASGDNGGSID